MDAAAENESVMLGKASYQGCRWKTLGLDPSCYYTSNSKSTNCFLTYTVCFTLSFSFLPHNNPDGGSQEGFHCRDEETEALTGWETNHRLRECQYEMDPKPRAAASRSGAWLEASKKNKTKHLSKIQLFINLLVISKL